MHARGLYPWTSAGAGSRAFRGPAVSLGRGPTGGFARGPGLRDNVTAMGSTGLWRSPHRSIAAARAAGPVRRLAALLVLAGVALLAGCATLPVVYNRLDWWAPLYVQNYVSLSTSQRVQLRREIAALRDWHCRTQLGEYAAWAANLANELHGGDLHYGRIDALYGEVQRAWSGIATAASHRAAGLLLALSPRQIEQLFEELEKDNRTFERRYVARAPAAAEAEYAERMEKQLSGWIGALTAEQRRAVADWAREVRPTGAERLAARRLWQAELRAALAERREPAVFHTQVRRLFVAPEELGGEEHAQARSRYRESLVALLARVAASLTPEQREQLIARTRAWQRDFERLACAGGRGSLRAAAEPPDVQLVN